MINTHNTTCFHQKKFLAAHIVTRLIAAVTGQVDVTTFAKSGTSDCRMDAILEETGA